jgi:hypothetical protein
MQIYIYIHFPVNRISKFSLPLSLECMFNEGSFYSSIHSFKTSILYTPRACSQFLILVYRNFTRPPRGEYASQYLRIHIVELQDLYLPPCPSLLRYNDSKQSLCHYAFVPSWRNSCIVSELSNDVQMPLLENKACAL